MEWTNRGANQNQPGGQATNPSNHPGNNRNKQTRMNGFYGLTVALLFSVTLLVLAVVCYISFGAKTINSENKYVDGSKMQAIFLNGGQVYFGNITNLNNRYVRVNNIYYLRVNQQVQPNQSTTTNNDVTLVKLGCELHGPEDEMLINREQVIFWENLKSDGQVAKAVQEFVKANPDGQKCDTTTTTNPSSTTPTKKQ